MTTEDRWTALMNRKVRVYDNGGRTLDRYTAIIKRSEKGTPAYDVYTMSEVQGPQGFNCFSHTEYDGRRVHEMIKGDKRVLVESLPQEVIEAIEYRI